MCIACRLGVDIAETQIGSYDPSGRIDHPYFCVQRCEILIERVVLKANLILLEMWDFDVMLGMDWLSTHRMLMDCFTKKVVFQKLGLPELEFEGDCRVFPTCMISTLKEKRLLHKGCEAYLTHVIDTSTLNVTL